MPGASYCYGCNCFYNLLGDFDVCCQAIWVQVQVQVQQAVLGLVFQKKNDALKDALKNKLAYFGLSAQKGEGGMVEITKKLLDQMGIQMLKMAPT